MKILMVCLGNICRSPMAEGILRQKIKEKNLAWQVDSCGTGSWHVGQTPDTRAQATAQNHQIDISMLRARQFSVKDFDDFDLIFAMDTSNYNDVRRLARNETDKEKVKMILNESFPKQNRAVPDPYYGGDHGFEQVFLLLDDACDAIIQHYS
ncbi:MAG: low molecular weight protein-tyrosine-phosphatase [Chitinophagales bacterium]|nr:low molecular weight phosphotyrosine protein phosphatase [Bacteroidota bacterium]MCB9042319.1 low molecular weight phosphotyrosine protein phosphatase [Chitinophagales bacterium]